MTDRQIWLYTSLLLFFVSVWPVWFVYYPPNPDLGGHGAALTVRRHPELYADHISTGLFKTNAALFLFDHLLKNYFSVRISIKLFLSLCLFANSFLFTWFIAHFRGAKHLFVATPFLALFVEHFFIDMGTLNFSLSVVLSLPLIACIDKQMEKPHPGIALFMAFWSIVVWYCHGIPLILIAMMTSTYVAFKTKNFSYAEIKKKSRTLFQALFPLSPAFLILAGSIFRHQNSRLVGAPLLHYFSNIYDLVYGIWGQFIYGYSKLSIPTFAFALALAYFAFIYTPKYRGKNSFLGSNTVLLFCLGSHFLTPSLIFEEGLLDARILPYFWMGILLRLPEKLKPLHQRSIYGFSIFTVALQNAEYIYAARDTDQFMEAASLLPDRAKLLPLVFKNMLSAQHIPTLDTASGWYVTEKHTPIVDVWDGNISMPIVRIALEDMNFDRLLLRRFILVAKSPAELCQARFVSEGAPKENCEQRFVQLWDDKWSHIQKHYEYILLWATPSDVMRTIPKNMETLFRGPHLLLLKNMTYDPKL